MPLAEVARPSHHQVPAPTAEPAGERWHGLDVLKGLALWAMVAHHVHRWAGGHVEERFVGFDGFLLTELAAPAFAVALGAGAAVVGRRVRAPGDLAAPMRRWAQILLVGLAIDLVTHRGIEGRGVLPTLAILGAAVTAATAAGLRRPTAWWGIAAAAAAVAGPISSDPSASILGRLVGGPFALPVYAVFAAAGAAVASSGAGERERGLPLLRGAVGVLAAGALAATFAGGAVAPDGLWPPDRYPGTLAFTMWGLAGSLVLWALVRRALPAGGWLSDGIARAGRRTLLVFTAHFAIKVALQLTGLTGRLDTWRWGLATWAVVVAICVASALPHRRVRPPVPARRLAFRQ